MAHHVYNTEGFVLDSIPIGEANKLYTLLTKDVGVIRATAQGVRLGKSKLRFSLQDFSHSKLSLVRGKDMWRITNAKSIENMYTLYARSPVLYALANIFSLIKRLVQGEEKNEALFSSVSEAFLFLKNEPQEALLQKYSKAFEYILVIKILHNLGYMRHMKELALFIESAWSQELLQKMVGVEKIALKEINSALRESQL
jgi:DNA repair protein RecO